MKRIVFCLMLSVLAITGFTQKVTIMAGAVDTLHGAQTKYFPIPEAESNLVQGSFAYIFDHQLGASDSTYVKIQGSIDGTNYVDLGSSAYADIISYTAAAPTTFKTVRFLTTDATFIWPIAEKLTLPYYRYAVTHYATGTIRNYGYVYKKK